MTTLANKTALVTGASRGIGRATAQALAAAGARVIVHYSRSTDRAKAVVDQICAAGGRADAAFMALRILAKVVSGSVKNMTPKREKTKSKLFAGKM